MKSSPGITEPAQPTPDSADLLQRGIIALRHHARHSQQSCGKQQLDGRKRRHADRKTHVLVIQPALQTQHPEGERQRAQPPHPGRISRLHRPLHLWRHWIEIPAGGLTGQHQGLPSRLMKPTGPAQGDPFGPSQLEAVDVKHHTPRGSQNGIPARYGLNKGNTLVKSS